MGGRSQAISAPSSGGAYQLNGRIDNSYTIPSPIIHIIMPKSYVKLKRRIQDVQVDLTSQEKPNTVSTAREYQCPEQRLRAQSQSPAPTINTPLTIQTLTRQGSSLLASDMSPSIQKLDRFVKGSLA